MTGKNLEPLRWRNGVLEVIDQTLLPAKLAYVRLANVGQVCAAIKTMKVRGAPLIGVVGAYGLVLSVKKVKTRDLAEARTQLRKWADILIQTRPTGVNLRWAVERVFNASTEVGDVSSLKEVLLKEADAIFNGELEAARRIGKYGSALLEDGDTVLTHCNAGALATVGYGTSLAVVRAAVEQGKRISVIATETRPLLQGSRLTAFELAHDMVTEPSRVVIEERNQREVLYVAGRRVAPRSVEALNPAFDVTPPELVTGIVTDRGMAGPPFVDSLRSLSG